MQARTEFSSFYALLTSLLSLNLMMFCASFAPATLLKLTFLHGCFSSFQSCTNGTKSGNTPYIFSENQLLAKRQPCKKYFKFVLPKQAITKIYVSKVLEFLFCFPQTSNICLQI